MRLTTDLQLASQTFLYDLPFTPQTSDVGWFLHFLQEQGPSKSAIFFLRNEKKIVMSLNDNKFSIKSKHKPCLSNLGNIDERSGLCSKPFFHDCNWCYTDFLVALSNDLPCPCHLIAHSNHKMWPIVRRVCNDLWIRAFY